MTTHETLHNPALSSSTPTISRMPRRTTVILAVVLVTQLMIVLDAAIVNIALPDIQRELSMNSASLSWVVNAYTLAFGGLLLLGSRLGDILGRRTTFLAGLILFTASSVLGGVATNAPVLLSARALQGVGAALLAPAALTILMSSVSPGRQQTRAIGWYTVVSASGAAIGLIAGGVLTDLASWRWVFFVNAPIGIAVLAAALIVLPRTRITRAPADALGAVLVTVGMSALVYGFIRAAEDGWSDAGTLMSFVTGAVLLGGFVLNESMVAHPITPLRLFVHQERSTAYVARLLLVAGSMGAFFFMSQYLQLVLGWTPLQTGLAFLPIPLSVFASSQVVSRRLADRYSVRMIAGIGMALSAIGLGSMALVLGEHTSYAAMVLPMILLGLGNGTAFVPLTAAGLTGVEPADRGVASGLVNVTQQLGGALGLAVLVTVFATAHPTSSTPAAVTDAFVTGADRGFAVAAGLLAAGFAVLMVALRPRRGGTHELALDDELILAES